MPAIEDIPPPPRRSLRNSLADLVIWGFVVWLKASRVEREPEPERVAA